MVELAVRWLNEEICLSKSIMVEDLEKEFSDGRLFGETLVKSGLLEPIFAEKLLASLKNGDGNTFRAIFTACKRAGIKKLPPMLATDIATERHGAATRLILKIRAATFSRKNNRYYEEERSPLDLVHKKLLKPVHNLSVSKSRHRDMHGKVSEKEILLSASARHYFDQAENQEQTINEEVRDQRQKVQKEKICMNKSSRTIRYEKQNAKEKLERKGIRDWIAQQRKFRDLERRDLSFELYQLACKEAQLKLEREKSLKDEISGIEQFENNLNRLGISADSNLELDCTVAAANGSDMLKCVDQNSSTQFVSELQAKSQQIKQEKKEYEHGKQCDIIDVITNQALREKNEKEAATNIVIESQLLENERENELKEQKILKQQEKDRLVNENIASMKERQSKSIEEAIEHFCITTRQSKDFEKEIVSQSNNVVSCVDKKRRKHFEFCHEISLGLADLACDLSGKGRKEWNTIKTEFVKNGRKNANSLDTTVCNITVDYLQECGECAFSYLEHGSFPWKSLDDNPCPTFEIAQEDIVSGLKQLISGLSVHPKVEAYQDAFSKRHLKICVVGNLELWQSEAIVEASNVSNLFLCSIEKALVAADKVVQEAELEAERAKEAAALVSTLSRKENSKLKGSAKKNSDTLEKPLVDSTIAPANPPNDPPKFPDDPSKTAFIEASMSYHKLIHEGKKAAKVAPTHVILNLMLLYLEYSLAARERDKGETVKIEESCNFNRVKNGGWVMMGYPSSLLEAKMLEYELGGYVDDEVLMSVNGGKMSKQKALKKGEKGAEVLDMSHSTRATLDAVLYIPTPSSKTENVNVSDQIFSLSVLSFWENLGGKHLITEVPPIVIYSSLALERHVSIENAINAENNIGNAFIFCGEKVTEKTNSMNSCREDEKLFSLETFTGVPCESKNGTNCCVNELNAKSKNEELEKNSKVQLFESIVILIDAAYEQMQLTSNTLAITSSSNTSTIGNDNVNTIGKEDLGAIESSVLSDKDNIKGKRDNTFETKMPYQDDAATCSLLNGYSDRRSKWHKSLPVPIRIWHMHSTGEHRVHLESLIQILESFNQSQKKLLTCSMENIGHIEFSSSFAEGLMKPIRVGEDDVAKLLIHTDSRWNSELKKLKKKIGKFLVHFEEKNKNIQMTLASIDEFELLGGDIADLRHQNFLEAECIFKEVVNDAIRNWSKGLFDLLNLYVQQEISIYEEKKLYIEETVYCLGNDDGLCAHMSPEFVTLPISQSLTGVQVAIESENVKTFQDLTRLQNSNNMNENFQCSRLESIFQDLSSTNNASKFEPKCENTDLIGSQVEVLEYFFAVEKLRLAKRFRKIFGRIYVAIFSGNDEVQKALCRVRNLVKHRTRLEYTTISATASHFRNALKSENCEAIKNLLSSVDSISFNDSFTDSIDPYHVISWGRNKLELNSIQQIALGICSIANGHGLISLDRAVECVLRMAESAANESSAVFPKAWQNSLYVHKICAEFITEVDKADHASVMSDFNLKSELGTKKLDHEFALSITDPTLDDSQKIVLGRTDLCDSKTDDFSKSNDSELFKEIKCGIEVTDKKESPNCGDQVIEKSQKDQVFIDWRLLIHCLICAHLQCLPTKNELTNMKSQLLAPDTCMNTNIDWKKQELWFEKPDKDASTEAIRAMYYQCWQDNSKHFDGYSFIKSVALTPKPALPSCFSLCQHRLKTVLNDENPMKVSCQVRGFQQMLCPELTMCCE